MLQGQRDVWTVGGMLLSELTPLVNAHQGVIYQMEAAESEEEPHLRLLSAFADAGEDGHAQHLRLGDGLLGQCAVEKRSMVIADLPAQTGPIRSGLFQARPHKVEGLSVPLQDSVQ